MYKYNVRKYYDDISDSYTYKNAIFLTRTAYQGINIVIIDLFMFSRECIKVNIDTTVFDLQSINTSDHLPNQHE